TLIHSQGSCPWPESWFRTHGAHLVCQVRGDLNRLHGSSRRRHPLWGRAMAPRARDPHAILKERLRVALRGRRRTLAGESPHAADEAAALLPLRRLPPFQVVGGYHPLGAELDPRPVMARLAQAGATLALP